MFIKYQVSFPELEPENVTALEIRAQTNYEKCAFERALLLAHCGKRLRRVPPNFDECARHAEETVMRNIVIIVGLFCYY